MAKRTYNDTPDNVTAQPLKQAFDGEPTGLKRRNGRLLTQEEVALRTLQTLEVILAELKMLNETVLNIR